MNKKSVAGKKAWTGDFGESFLAHLLSQEGIDVVRANTVGFDLFAIDNTGKIFPCNKQKYSAFVFPLKEWKKLRGNCKRKDTISVTELNKIKIATITKLF